MRNSHNINVLFWYFLAAVYASDYSQPILKMSMTDFESSENSPDLGHFEKTQSSQGGMLRDMRMVPVDPGYSLDGAGGITNSRPPCNLNGETCCKSR